MSFKRWIIPKINKEEINGLAEECGLDPFVTLLSYSRGYTDPFSLDMFLSKEVFDIDPFEFADMDIACDRVKRAVLNNEKITVYGDYDCDGITSTALMYLFLKSLGAEVDYYIPNRAEGYGMSMSSVEKIAAKGTKLIITVDNGICANNEVLYAKELGVETVITDHHLQQGDLPKAIAVVDPHRDDCFLDFKDFAGVGVAFMLALAVSGLSCEAMLEQYGDLVALGTVADVMPLKAENRCIVALGLKKIINNPNKGLKELLLTSVSKLEDVNTTTLGFSAAPRINAAGRMGDASRAVRLIISNDIREIQSLVNELNVENQNRQIIEKQIASEAIKTIISQKLYLNRVIVVMGEEWKEGVLGIAAGKLAEYFGKPIILLTHDKENNIAKGSARSVGKFSIFKAINSCADLLLKFGGHDMAAGLSLETDKLDVFRRKVNEFAKTSEYPVLELHIDCKLNPEAVNLDLVEALKPLEPYGTGNPIPVFGLFNMKLIRIIPMGNRKHLRLILCKNDITVAAVMFNKAPEDFSYHEGCEVDIAVTLQSSEYQDMPQLNVIIKDIRRSGRNDDVMILGFKQYEELTLGELSSSVAKEIYFNRSEMGDIYRAVKSGGDTLFKLTENFTKYSFAKICAMVEVMEELGLVSTEGYMDNRKIKLNITEKVDLLSSEIYRNLKVLSGEV